MACTTPILTAQSDLVEHVTELAEGPLDERAAIRAINSAIGTLSSRVKACFCYEPPCPVECGVCEYPLPCCGIRDVVPWIKPFNCGCRPVGSYTDGCCGNESCWRRLDTYSIECDNLVTDGTVEGWVRLQIYVDNPVLPLDCWTLAKDFVVGDSEIWISGRVQLPPLGWFRLGDCDQDFVSFRCWEQTEYQQPEMLDVRELESWVDGGIDPNVGTEQPGIDPDGGVVAGADIDCGVNTVAYTIGEYCFSGFNRTYAKGETVELAVATPTAQVLESLKNQALVHAHKSLLSRCQSAQDRQFYADRMQLYAELAQNDMIGYKNDRKATQRSTRETSFWFNGGKGGRCRTRPRRMSAGKRLYISR